MLITADRVLCGGRLLSPGWVQVTGDRITGVGEGEAPLPADAAFGAATVAPGFVDVHAHGGGGRSFTEGTDEAAHQVVATHRAQGTTTMMASLVTESLDVLERSVRTLASAVADGLLAGIHLEGPWLSRAYAGAHDEDRLTAPDRRSIERLLGAGDGTIRMVTLAPELPGAIEATRFLVGQGVKVAIGHTDATYELTRAALEAGASVGTHLFNAMRGVHHRDPGPAVALLEHPDTWVEVVADGVHLHPAIIRSVAATKSGRFVLVTDAMAAAASDDGSYRLGPVDVEVRDGVARLPDNGAIAGSTATMAQSVHYCVQVARLPLLDTLRAATETPAAMLGLGDVGILRPGARADLVVLDEQLTVSHVMHAGAWLPSTTLHLPSLAPKESSRMHSTTVTVGSSVGLHARPAALIAEAAGEESAAITLSLAGGDPVDASSSLLLMTLGAKYGDLVEVAGDDGEAVARIAKMVEQDLDLKDGHG